MRIDALSPLAWQDINKKVQSALNTPAKVQVFRGLHQALFEILFGLHLRYPQKRKVIAQMGFGDHLRASEIELAKLGVRFKTTFEEPLDKEEKATVAFVWDVDDSITSELYRSTDDVSALAATKIVRVKLIHHATGRLAEAAAEVLENDIVICGLDSHHAIAFLGEKILLPNLSVGLLHWDSLTDSSDFINLTNANSQNFKDAILAFEGQLPSDVSPWFSTQQSRLFDRAAVIVKGRDSSALVALLNELLPDSQRRPGVHAAFESPSYCRWANDLWFEQAPKFQRTPEDLQGLLLIDGAVLTPQFNSVFNQALQKLKVLAEGH